MSHLAGNYATFSRPLVPVDPSFAECTPQGRFSRLTDIAPDFLAGLNIEHVVVDFDGTMLPYGLGISGISQETTEWLRLIGTDPRFKSLSIATARGGFDEIEDLVRWDGVK